MTPTDSTRPYKACLPAKSDGVKHLGAQLAALCAIWMLSSTSVFADELSFPGLQALMSEEEFSQTGLDQLTPIQRATLNQWLSQRAKFKLEKTERDKNTKPVTAKRLSRVERSAVKPVRTRIVGKFTGWSGSTIFQLETGEYWKQRQTGRYYYKAESPEVELFKNRMGFWEIRILATGRKVKVSRIDP